MNAVPSRTRYRIAAALATAAVALPASVAAAGGASSASPALVPNAIAFRDRDHGLLGTGWLSCENGGFGCRPKGTISLTGDGGRTWRVTLRTPRPVVWVGFDGRIELARLDDGENLASEDGGRTWAPTVAPPEPVTPCPWGSEVRQVAVTPKGREWALCAGQPGVGNEDKEVYRLTLRGWRRIAYTPMAPSGGYGGISVYGYPEGIAMADDGFGLIWESRGTLYVTRNGGVHWLGLQRVARPEIDFGQSACVLPGGRGYVLLALGGTEHRRLLETTDAGRTWRVVHRWS